MIRASDYAEGTTVRARRDALYALGLPLPTWRGWVGTIRLGWWTVEANCETGEVRPVRSRIPPGAPHWQSVDARLVRDEARAITVAETIRARFAALAIRKGA